MLAPFLLLSTNPYTAQRHTHQDGAIIDLGGFAKAKIQQTVHAPLPPLSPPVSHTLFDTEKIVALYASLRDIFTLTTFQTF